MSRTSIAGAMTAFLLPWIAGYGVAGLIPGLGLPRRWRIAFGYPLGAVLLYGLSFPCLLFLSGGASMAVAAGGLVICAAGASWLQAQALGTDDQPRRRIAAIAMAPSLIVLIHGARAIGHSTSAYDAIVTWAMKGKHILAFGIDEGFFTRGYPLMAYPLYVPIQTAWIGAAAGGWDDRLVCLFPTFQLAATMALALSWAVDRRCKLVPAVMGVLLFSFSPALSRVVANVMADLPLALHVAVSALFLERARERTGHSDFAVAGVFAAAAVATKQEGQAALMPLTLAAAIVARARDQAPLRSFCTFLAPPALTAGSWFLFLWVHDIGGGFADHPAEPLRFPMLAPALLRTMGYLGRHTVYGPGEREGWLLLLPVLLLSISARPRAFTRNGGWSFLLVAVSMLFLDAVALVISPYNLEHLYLATVPRLVVQVAPLALLALIASWGAVDPGADPITTQRGPGAG